MLMNKDKNNPAGNMICIINGIFHGISSQDSGVSPRTSVALFRAINAPKITAVWREYALESRHEMDMATARLARFSL
jgi:hypothetical protein